MSNEIFDFDMKPITKQGKSKLKHEDISMFSLGLTTMSMASINHILTLTSPIYTLVLGVCGVGSIVYHYFDKNDKLNKLWQGIGFIDEKDKPKLREKINTAYGHCLRFSIPVGKSTDEFEKRKVAIKQFLDRDSKCNKINIKYSKGGNMLWEIYEKELKRDYEFEIVKTKGFLELVIGYTYGEKLITVDLTDGMPHMLIAGETGSGKSTIVRQILTTLILTKDKNELELDLIDLKNGVEFNVFKECDMVNSFCKNKEEAEELLYKIDCEVERRYEMFNKKDCVDIYEYNKKYKKNKLKYKLVVVDEFADLRSEKDSLDIIQTLGQKARACGIHLLLCTQRPSAKIINGDIKANIPIILGLKTNNGLNSRIIIDENGLEDLKGKGNGILLYEGKKEIQGMYLSADNARKMIKEYKNKSILSNNSANKKNSNLCKFVKTSNENAINQRHNKLDNKNIKSNKEMIYKRENLIKRLKGDI